MSGAAMTDKIDWIYQAGSGCAYCKDGLCQRMNQLMEDGHSQRAAARVMEDECGGKWKAENIKKLFQNWTGENIPHPKPQITTEEVFMKKYKSFLVEVKKAKKTDWSEMSYSLACDLIGDLNDYLIKEIK